jgi:hypothetical protein
MSADNFTCLSGDTVATFFCKSDIVPEAEGPISDFTEPPSLIGSFFAVQVLVSVCGACTAKLIVLGVFRERESFALLVHGAAALVSNISSSVVLKNLELVQKHALVLLSDSLSRRS